MTHHPSEDEAGEEGVAVRDLPEGQKKLVVGKRFAVEKSKQQNHDSKEDQAEAFGKMQDKMMKVSAVDKAPVPFSQIPSV